MRGVTVTMAACLGLAQAGIGLSTMARDRVLAGRDAVRATMVVPPPPAPLLYGGSLPTITVTGRFGPVVADWRKVLPARPDARAL